MKRRLCITVSVFFALVAVALCVLWVRSFAVRDTVWWPRNNFGMELSSLSGHMVLIVFDRQHFGGVLPPYNTFHEPINPDRTLAFTHGVLGFGLRTEPNLVRIDVPFWFVMLACVVSATAPWVNWSKTFSLRTLLIATTLVAGVLGLAVWASG
jgi:hypothetical protein